MAFGAGTDRCRRGRGDPESGSVQISPDQERSRGRWATVSTIAVMSRLAQPARAEELEVLALEVGMVVALLCREQWLPWQVVGQAVRFGELPLVRLPLRRTGVPWSTMQRLFGTRETVLVVPRHHSVCVRCGALGPCADELVERELRARVEAGELARAPGLGWEAPA